MDKTLNEKRIHIPFHLHPYKFEEGLHAVEKADSSGNKRRYLYGFSSGMKVDGHGERMTKECVEHMHQQAKSGSIPLFVGQHEVNHSDDIGILIDSSVTKNGEWVTTYRLYDELDGFKPGGQTLERADKLWRQVNGLPPYIDKEGNPKPLQKGFSVEGYIPEGGIVSMSGNGQRVISKVDLDGTLVTPRPSYKDSVITAVYKALDELTPQKRVDISQNIRGKFINKIEDENRKQNYYSKRFKLDDALNESIEDIMSRGIEVRDRLNLLFDEYKMMVIELLIDSAGVFTRPPDQPDIPDNQGEVDVAKMQRMRLFKSIEGQLMGFLDAKSRAYKSKIKENKHARRTSRSKRTNTRRKTSH